MNQEFIPKTVEELACYWFHVHGMTHKAASSLKRDQGILRNYLLPAFGYIKLEELKTRSIYQWFSELQKKYQLSPKSCNDILGLFKKILNDGVIWELIKTNPAARVKKLKSQATEMSFWNKDEVQNYLGYWQAKSEHPRILWASTVALYTGMRRGELIALKWDCVESDMIVVKRSYCRIVGAVKEETKSKKIRRVPINRILLIHLKKLKVMTTSTGFVLPFILPDRYHVEFKVSVTRAGVRPIRFHDLRHTFASNFVMGGGNIYDLQKILGHSTVQVTERYTHLVPSHLKGKTEVLGF